MTNVVAVKPGISDELGPIRIPPLGHKVGGPNLDPWSALPRDPEGFITNWKMSHNLEQCLAAGWILFDSKDLWVDLPIVSLKEALEKRMMLLMKLPMEIANPLLQKQEENDRKWLEERKKEVK